MQILPYVECDMSAFFQRNKPAVAALLVFFTICAPVAADEAPAELFEALVAADKEAAEIIAQDIRDHWAQSGSDTIDLLLERGRQALDRGDTRAAIEHLTALTDHAPEFAEGWHARAQAYFTAELIGPALGDLEHALALEPNHFDAMVGVGIILEMTGANQDALDIYYMVRSIHPHHPELAPAIERLESQLQGQDI